MLEHETLKWAVEVGCFVVLEVNVSVRQRDLLTVLYQVVEGLRVVRVLLVFSFLRPDQLEGFEPELWSYLGKNSTHFV